MTADQAASVANALDAAYDANDTEEMKRLVEAGPSPLVREAVTLCITRNAQSRSAAIASADQAAVKPPDGLDLRAWDTRDEFFRKLLASLR